MHFTWMMSESRKHNFFAHNHLIKFPLNVQFGSTKHSLPFIILKLRALLAQIAAILIFLLVYTAAHRSFLVLLSFFLVASSNNIYDGAKCIHTFACCCVHFNLISSRSSALICLIIIESPIKEMRVLRVALIILTLIDWLFNSFFFCSFARS